MHKCKANVLTLNINNTILAVGVHVLQPVSAAQGPIPCSLYLPSHYTFHAWWLPHSSLQHVAALQVLYKKLTTSNKEVNSQHFPGLVHFPCSCKFFRCPSISIIVHFASTALVHTSKCTCLCASQYSSCTPTTTFIAVHNSHLFYAKMTVLYTCIHATLCVLWSCNNSLLKKESQQLCILLKFQW